MLLSHSFDMNCLNEKVVNEIRAVVERHGSALRSIFTDYASMGGRRDYIHEKNRLNKNQVLASPLLDLGCILESLECR